MQQGTYGYDAEITTDMDLSNSSGLSLLLQRPDGTTFTRAVDPAKVNAAQKTVGWTVQSGDFNQPGTYQLQIMQDQTRSRLGYFYVAPNSSGVTGLEV